MDTETTISQPGATDFPTVHMVGNIYRILLRGIQTGGAYAAIDMIVPPLGGPDPHSHASIQETFYVLEGEIEVQNELETYIARKGAMVIIPLGGLIHCFKNKTNQIAHLLCIVVPAGLEEFFIEAGGHPAFNRENKGEEPSATEKAELKELAEKFGQTLYAADYLDRLKENP